LGLAVLKVVQRASQPGRSYRGHLGAMLIKIFYACQDFVVHKKFFIKAIIKKKSCSLKIILPPKTLKPGYRPGLNQSQFYPNLTYYIKIDPAP